jgi:ribosomal protein S12 methylthiotransferase
MTTLGCPKNRVDSDKLETRMLGEGMTMSESIEDADLVVINTCAFIDVAREESIATILDAADVKRASARLVVTGCLAERYGSELSQELPEVDLVAGFGVDFISEVSPPLSSVSLGNVIPRRPQRSLDPSLDNSLTPVVRTAHSRDREIALPAMDLLNLPRSAAKAPWAYIKVAEGCDKACGFCAIPSFRGPQVSRPLSSILDEVGELSIQEVVLVAQDLANYGRDLYGKSRLVDLYREVSRVAPWVRLLYLYPSELTPSLIEAIAESPVPYFDLSLQHVSRPLLRRMRRFGSGEIFLERIRTIRSLRSESTFRSNFIVGYPGETAEDQRELVEFVQEAELDWVGFFTYSNEEGTYAAKLDGAVDRHLALDRLNELTELQDRITQQKRSALIGEKVSVLVEAQGVARSFREAPEIDGVISVDPALPVGNFAEVVVDACQGIDLSAH